MKTKLKTFGPKLAGNSIVYVIDNDGGARASTVTLLHSIGLDTQDFKTADEFLATSLSDLPSCLVLDVRLRGLSGFDVQNYLTANGIGMPVIFATAHGDIAMSVRAMKAGALDFLTKPFRDQDLLDAVLSGLSTDEKRRSSARNIATLRQLYEFLTPRERQVMTMAANGLSNAQIAASLSVSSVTVKIHRGTAMRKMQSKSVADFVLKASALGLIEPELNFECNANLHRATGKSHPSEYATGLV